MNYAKALIAATGFVFWCSLCATAGDLKIIVNPSVKANSISADELRSVFLAERNSLRDGSHVEPVFERAGPAHETFLKEFLRESNESLQHHYGALVFTGKASMPKSFNSDSEVVVYVASTRGTIGYVSASASTEGVKVLDVGSQSSPSDRALLTRFEPEYPETLRQLHIGGTVRLLVTISPQGRVESVVLLGGNPILAESAIKAVNQWVYTPASSRSKIPVSVPFEPPR